MINIDRKQKDGNKKSDGETGRTHITKKDGKTVLIGRTTGPTIHGLVLMQLGTSGTG